MTGSQRWEYFSQDKLWKPAVHEQLVVAEDLISLIPSDVHSILDAGCGNGIITNQLVGKWDVVGCDISLSALKQVYAPALIADLRSLPFEDAHFDMVISSDVIEHLPDDIYSDAIAELIRVSRKYVLIAVPYKEILRSALVDCPACKLRYHAHLHQRSYSYKDLKDLFGPEFGVRSVKLSGQRWIYSDADIVVARRLFTGLDYPFEDAICPSCGERRGEFSHGEASIKNGRRFDALQAMLAAFGHIPQANKSEILILYEKGGSNLVPDWKPPTANEPFIPEKLVLAQLSSASDPISYPHTPIRIGIQEDPVVIALPRAPRTIKVIDGALTSVEVYDYVEEVYYSGILAEDCSYDLPITAFGPHGSLLRMYGCTQNLNLSLKFAPNLTREQIVARCFFRNADGSSQVQSVEPLLHITSELESKRAALEEKYYSLSTINQIQNRRINELLESAQIAENTRAMLEAQLVEQEVNKAKQESDFQFLLSALAEAEKKRDAVEKKYSDLSHLQRTQEERMSELMANSRESENLRETLEQALSVKDIIQAEQDQRLKSLFTELSKLENVRSELELRLGEKDLVIANLQQMVHNINAVANSIELARASLEESLSVKDASMSRLQDELNKLISHSNDHEGLRITLEAALTEQDALLTTQREKLLGIEALMASLEHGLDVNEIELKRQEDRASAELIANDISNSRKKRARAAVFGKTENNITSVLVLSHMYPRQHHPAGGIFVHEQVRALQTLGIDVRVLSGEPFWINTLNPLSILKALRHWAGLGGYTWEEIDGVPVIKFPYIVSGRFLPFEMHAFTYSLGATRCLDRLKSAFKFDLVHAHTSFTDGTAGARIAKRYRVPLVVTEHTGPFKTLTKSALLRWRTQRSINSSDKLVAVSSSLLGDISSQIKLKNKRDVAVIPNLVDINKFPVAPSSSCSEIIEVLWVGHFVPVKRVDILLKAFASACKHGSSFHLTLVGAGELEKELKELAKSLEIKDIVTFAGYADHAELANYYRKANFLVIPSESETFGVVAIEALSCGRPVLTTACGGPEDIVMHPSLGQVVGMSVDDLANGLLSMGRRRSEFDATLIRSVAENVFSSTKVATQVRDVYFDALGRHG